MGFIEEEVEQYRLQYSTESVELQVIHLSFFIWNSLLRCWAIQELNDIFGVIVQSLWFFGRCTFFFFFAASCLPPFHLYCFLSLPSLQVSQSLTPSQPNNTDANVIETPGASSASWSLTSVPATPLPWAQFSRYEASRSSAEFSV